MSGGKARSDLAVRADVHEGLLPDELAVQQQAEAVAVFGKVCVPIVNVSGHVHSVTVAVVVTM
jgi:hypothetical protein